MTNEEKLKKLFDVANENGWKIPTNIENAIGWGFDYDYINGIEWKTNYGFNSYSLNDLVCNFEEDEVSFIEALCIAEQKIRDTGSLYGWQSFRISWITLPTSKRLEYLFDCFKHLL